MAVPLIYAHIDPSYAGELVNDTQKDNLLQTSTGDPAGMPRELSRRVSPKIP